MDCSGIWQVLGRRKVLDNESVERTKLARVLTTGDLTALGVGSTLGVGVYVLTGHVAKEAAGPSVIISFLLAAVASVFAGLCYAEFGARLPRAGSAYIYSYVCVGEFIAFIIGWNLILEYAIGSASVSRGISLYLDSLLNDTMKTSFKESMPISVYFFSDYFDPLAFGLTFLIGVGLAFGLKKSTIVNNIFTIVNIILVIFVIAAGAFKADIDNWYITPNNSTQIEIGAGGFFPFGFAGTLKGAATCFFGFVGFDCIATTGEEVQNPKRAIPISIISSLAIIFLSYFGVSAILTLMVPYYLQNSDAPIPEAFNEVGWVWAKWIVAIGGIFGLFSSLFGALYPLPRILYAMASDGLIFHFIGDINSRFKTPVVGTILASLITGVIAGLFNLTQLVNMMSIGTLMAYTIVAACVLLLRYIWDDAPLENTDESCALLYNGEDKNFKMIENQNQKSIRHKKPLISTSKQIFEIDNQSDESENFDSSNFSNKKYNYTTSDIIRQMFNCSCGGNPTKISSIIIRFLIFFYFVFCIAFGLCLYHMWDFLCDGTVWSIVITSIFGFFMLVTILLMYLQPKVKSELSFQVPLVPLLPALSIFINICLMIMLDYSTWIRFGIWMAIGIPIYLISLFIYGRGSNYIANVQKSSVNDTISGNLNYAFVHTLECQERLKDTDSSIKILVQSPSISEMANNMESINDNDEEKLGNGKISNNHYSGVYANFNQEIKKTSESVENSSDYGVEIVELIDQVIKDEEEAYGEVYQYCEPVDVVNDQFVTIPPDHIDNNYTLNNSENDIPIESITEPNTPSVQNVVAMVHREDESIVMSANKENVNNSSLDVLIIPVTVNKEDNIDTREEEINNPNESSNEFIQTDISNEPVLETQPVVSENDKSFIPIPPPMDENFFNTPKITFKSKSVNLSKKKHEIFDDLEEKPENKDVSIDNSAIKPGRDFLNKLATIYGNPKRKSTRGISTGAFSNDINESSQPSNELKRNNSETDLMNALKLEILNFKQPIKEDKESLKSNTKHSAVEQNTLNGVHNGKPINSDHTDSNNTEISYDHSDQPKSKGDIKKMLEAVLVSGPTVKRSKSNAQSVKENSGDDSDPGLVLESEVIKPQSKENLSRTMKLQRARFENVLKFIQESQSRRESGEIGNPTFMTNDASYINQNSDR